MALDGLQSAISSTGSVGGSVVAIEPDTGAVKVMATIPGFNPNDVANEDTFDQLRTDEDAPLLNRPTQSTYQPGSTMKVVTAVAALDSGEFETSTTLNANSPVEISGVPLANSGGADFGTIDMTAALTNSVNTYWAQVGEQLGADTMVEYMKRFGFYSDPELDYPDIQMRPSGPYNADGDLVEEGFDVGRVAIGQGGEEGQLLSTPLQMAQVAGAVANDGKLMEPTFLQSATDPDGREIEELDPDEQSRGDERGDGGAGDRADGRRRQRRDGELGSPPRSASSPARPAPPRSTWRRGPTVRGSSGSRRRRIRRSRSRRCSSSARTASAARSPGRSRCR